MTYTLPQQRQATEAPPQTAFLVTSGDSREPANVASWPTQVELERIITTEMERNGWEVRRAAPVADDAKHGFVSSQREGIERLQVGSAGGAGDRRDAVWQYSHHVLAGPAHPPRPDPDRGQLRGAWPGLVGLLNLNAGLTKMGRRLLHALDGRLDRRLVPRGHRGPGSTPARVTHDTSHVRAAPARCPTPRRRSWAGRWPPSCSRRRPSSASSTRAAWACTTRSSTTSCSTRSASTRSGCRRARCRRRCSGSATTRPPRASAWLTGRGMTFRLGTDEQTELTDGSCSAVQDVRRRRADHRRLRPGRDRHPVPAGAQGPQPRVRPRRGPAQQRRAATGAQPRRRARAVRGRGRCRTSTRWTRAWPSTAW